MTAPADGNVFELTADNLSIRAGFATIRAAALFL